MSSPSTPTQPLAHRVGQCPRCASRSIKRWSQSSTVWLASCSRCSHVWQEKSRRGRLNDVLDKLDVVYVGVLAFSLVCLLGMFGLLLVAILDSDDRRSGPESAPGFLFLIILTLTVMFFIARRRVD